MIENKDLDTNISDSEWEVMRIVWTLEHAYTSQIIDQLKAKKNWSESTIKTLIRRLVQKGLLETTQEGRRFIYTPTVSQVAMMRRAATELLNKMCDMHKGEVIFELLKDSPISKSDLKMMSDEINKKEKTAPETVPCNCLENGSTVC